MLEVISVGLGGKPAASTPPAAALIPATCGARPGFEAMGKNKGSWRKFFCCAGPPETQSTTCLNISESDSFKPLSDPDPSEPELEQDQEEEEEEMYVEVELQTSKVEVPEGNRWRWSRLHREVELQTSTVSLLAAETELSSEADVQVQTSFSSLPRETEAQAQTSFLSLRCPTPFQNDAHAQTSFAELPGAREAEAQVQTSLSSLLGEQEAQVQTSLSSLPREKEVQVQTSLPSLSDEREAQVQTSLSSLPEEKQAQVQTSLLSLTREKEAQMQTSLSSLPEGKEAQVQTSFAFLPERRSAASLGSYIQGQSYAELLEKIASLPAFLEAQMQTSSVNLPSPSEANIQVQTSFSDYMSEKEETSSIGTEPQSKVSPQSSLSTLFPLYIDTEVQTLPVEIPPGNDWRSARLQAEAQVQTSFTSVLEELGDLIEAQHSKLELDKEEEMARELQVPFFIEEKSFSPELIETAIQTSDTLIRQWDKWRSLQTPQAIAEVQTSTIELLKKLSLLSRIECAEAASRTQLLKKASSLSVAEFPSYEVMRKASSWSDSGPQGQFSNDELLKNRPSSAQVLATSGSDITTSSSTRKSHVQTSDLELIKKLSSVSHMEPQEKASDIAFRKYSRLSLNDGGDENQKAITEGTECVAPPEITEAQIRKWYHELPEVQTSASQASVQKEPVWSTLVDSGVQTSYVEIPLKNRWRASRLQAEAEVQTMGLEMPVEDTGFCPQAQKDTQAQTSLLEIWQARDLVDAKMQTSDFDMIKKVQSPPPLVVDSQVQTSLFDLWKAEEHTDAQMQTSLDELQVIKSPPTEQIDRLVQTSFVDIWRAKDLSNVRQQTSLKQLLEPELESSPHFQSDLGVQTSLMTIWKEKGITDAQAQTSLSELLESQEELPLVSQIDAQVQTSNSEMSVGDSWRRPCVLADVQQQTSLELDGELDESPPPSQIDIQVQTSLLDIWKAKELHNAQLQTSWIDLPEPTKESPLPQSCESPVLYPEPGSPPLAQIDTQVQTSSLDIWKTKDVNDMGMQTSLSYLPQVTEELSLQPQKESPVQPTVPGLADAPDQGLPQPQVDLKQQAVLDMPKGFPDTPSSSETEVPTGQLRDAQVQSSLTSLPSGTAISRVSSATAVSLGLSRSAVSPAPSATAVSPAPSAMALSPAPSATTVSPAPSAKAASPVPSATAVSPTPSATTMYPVTPGTAASPIPSRTAVSPVPSQITPSPIPSNIPVSAVPSRTASPMRPPTPASPYSPLDSATPEKKGAPVEKSLLELWTAREEAEVQMQTAKLGLSFEEDLLLFPKPTESQEKVGEVKPSERKKVEQVSKAKSKAPVFTEAQVQTSYVDIPRGKKWRSSRLCTEAQVQTSFHDLHVKDRTLTLHDHIAPRRAQKGPKRASPVSVHLHVKMSPKRRTSNEKK
ncbi:hypothetical protein JRQ81_004446 [Phrynocephalus forsythii]|uniref:Uncharacterized protein n=1 Tax=Phrynocephalus forsythii TaxID=171643 RepID=A0A9Q0XF69_9SAUR|nr:hypothetical protein JRQ81_004446 [Phrynocephalus forsythii]